jgi:dihydroorotase
MEDFRTISLKNWTVEKTTNEVIQVGCLQRIADSLEKIEKPYINMCKEADVLRKYIERQDKEMAYLKRAIAGLRGRITRLHGKNQK